MLGTNLLDELLCAVVSGGVDPDRRHVVASDVSSFRVRRRVTHHPGIFATAGAGDKRSLGVASRGIAAPPRCRAGPAALPSRPTSRTLLVVVQTIPSTKVAMKILPISDLPRAIDELSRSPEQDEVVLTANGRPAALLTRVNEDDLDELLEELRLARARIALRRLQRDATERHLDRVTDAEAFAAITEARAERRAALADTSG